MNLEVLLVAALKGFFQDRMYPNVFPQAPSTPVWPSLRYTIIDSSPVVDLCGDGGDETADTRVQFDIVALTYKQVQQLRDQVKTALAAFDPPAIWQGESNLWDIETRTHRCQLDYVFYPSSDDATGA